MVADFARVVVRCDEGGVYERIRNEAAEYRQEQNHKVNVKGVGKSLEITARGISSHGSRPQEGLNAISIMMDFLSRISFACEDINEFISFYNEHIGFSLNGEGMGCGLSDEVSGDLIFNTGTVDISSEAAILTINVRYPVTLDENTVYDSMKQVLNRYNLGLVKQDHKPPIYFPKDHPLIVTLMGVYRRHTGDAGSEPVITGGGTYARAADNLVAFGATFPGDEDVAHKKNEYIEIDKLILMAKIYADAIYELSKPGS
jgi:succinyl-diaminopimelate desuccinylase